jgi:hypothetical protein
MFLCCLSTVSPKLMSGRPAVEVGGGRGPSYRLSYGFNPSLFLTLSVCGTVFPSTPAPRSLSVSLEQVSLSVSLEQLASKALMSFHLYIQLTLAVLSAESIDALSDALPDHMAEP